MAYTLKIQTHYHEPLQYHSSSENGSIHKGMPQASFKNLGNFRLSIPGAGDVNLIDIGQRKVGGFSKASWGVLVMGSGNLIHNLHTYAWGRHKVEPFDWAVRFEERARALLLAGNDGPLVAYETLGRDALLAAPTPDHYLPLVYVIALRREGERVTFPVEGVDGGSVSMLSVRVG